MLKYYRPTLLKHVTTPDDSEAKALRFTRRQACALARHLIKASDGCSHVVMTTYLDSLMLHRSMKRGIKS